LPLEESLDLDSPNVIRITTKEKVEFPIDMNLASQSGYLNAMVDWNMKTYSNIGQVNLSAKEFEWVHTICLIVC
jgi:hypothetical protein